MVKILMKHPRRTRSGFTLVELLVVIAIIAVLASVVTVAANAAINAAKRAKGSNTANQIKTAVINYYTEYGVYPLPTGSASTDTLYNDNDQGDWQPLSFCLCGNINPGVSGGATQGTSGTVANTRNIPFLTLKKSDVDANGVPLLQYCHRRRLQRNHW
jgi:prepilin-type N-terminal cleavage/methylation domain-containing protein